MAGSMKDIKLRIKSVESTMQITKAMELVASSKMRRAKERVEHSRPYFETLHDTLTGIAAADPRARSPYLRRAEIKRTLLVVIAGDRGLAGGYNSNVLKQAEAQQGPVTVLPIGKRSQEYFAHHGADLFTEEVLLAAEDPRDTMLSAFALCVGEALAYVMIFLVSFIVLLVLIHWAASVFDIFTRLPVIHSCNALLGGALGLVCGLVLCTVVLWAVKLVAPAAYSDAGLLSPSVMENSAIAGKLVGWIDVVSRFVSIPSNT